MPAFLKNKWLWIGLVAVIALIIGFSVFQNAQAAKKAEAAAAAEKKVESPYAAIANGKVDIEGGIIQIAARRGGVVREVLVQEGDRVTCGQLISEPTGLGARIHASIDGVVAAVTADYIEIRK